MQWNNQHVFVTDQEVQWQFVHGLFELAIYGGRVDNPFDVNVMISYLLQFFEAGTLSQQSKNKRLGPIRLPTSTNFRVSTVKPVIGGHVKRRPKLVFKADCRLMQVESIAECSPWSILQYF